MATVGVARETVSVSDASARGLAGLVRDAENGHEFIVARHGRPVAAVVGMARFESLLELERDLRSACLVVARVANDTGVRSDLADVIAAFGFDRGELDEELTEDLSSDRY